MTLAVEGEQETGGQACAVYKWPVCGRPCKAQRRPGPGRDLGWHLCPAHSRRGSHTPVSVLASGKNPWQKLHFRLINLDIDHLVATLQISLSPRSNILFQD